MNPLLVGLGVTVYVLLGLGLADSLLFDPKRPTAVAVAGAWRDEPWRIKSRLVAFWPAFLLALAIALLASLWVTRKSTRPGARP